MCDWCDERLEKTEQGDFGDYCSRECLEEAEYGDDSPVDGPSSETLERVKGRLHGMGSHTIKEIHLFAGAGGGILGSMLLPGHQLVCAVEKDPNCANVLKQRMLDGLIDDAPIWDDVRTFDGYPWRGLVDVVHGGFPCQGFSVAGKQHAQRDERNLWPDTARVIRETQPTFAFLENVPGLLSGRHGYFGHILSELADMGFDARWCVLSAKDVGAPQVRKRLWVLATHTERLKVWKFKQRQSWGYQNAVCPEGEAVPVQHGNAGAMARPQASRWWTAEPSVGRVAHGVASRMDRHRALGNGQVPAVAAQAWTYLYNKTTQEGI